MKKLIVFDLDGTLAASKMPITNGVSILLGRLLDKFQVCAISGKTFEDVKSQLVDHLSPSFNLASLHLMPANGTLYYQFRAGDWHQEYSEELPAADRQRIAGVLTEGAKSLGIWEPKTWGEVVEDRGSEVSFSGLGQNAPLDAKKVWDPDNRKRQALRDYCQSRLPGYEVSVAGTTSVDVTRQGHNKAFGIRKLQDILGIGPEETLFIGDDLEVGGNDHPAKLLGIETIAVKGPADATKVIERLLNS
jgi:hypothetical protein